MKFSQVGLDIYLSRGSVKRLALIPPLKHVGFPDRFVKNVGSHLTSFEFSTAVVTGSRVLRHSIFAKRADENSLR